MDKSFGVDRVLRNQR